MVTTPKKTKAKRDAYLKRKLRSNTKIKAQNYDIRIVIQKSNKSISAQAIEASGAILGSISDTVSKAATKTERAQEAGKLLAEKVGSLKEKKFVFDRNGHMYHGRIKAFAEGLREGGIAI